MIITQTPLRVSFLGGGSDYPEHFLQHGGATLATTINRYCLVSVHPVTSFSDHTYRIHYSKVESVGSIDEIQHPSARECLRAAKVEKGVEIHYLNDLPARTGLGSSSAATVGLLRALHAFQGHQITREELAAQAVQVERDLIQERVGYQDQYASTFGGFLHLQFGKEGRIQVDPVPMKADRMRDVRASLLLLYTGLQRTAHEVLEEQIDRTKSGTLTSELNTLKDLANDGVALLAGSKPLTEFGELLHQGWVIKRRLSTKVSDPRIDNLYEKARKAGVIGGKLLGAGSGGFLLLLAPPERHAAVLAALPELRLVDFDFEPSGSTTIFYRP